MTQMMMMIHSVYDPCQLYMLIYKTNNYKCNKIAIYTYVTALSITICKDKFKTIVADYSESSSSVFLISNTITCNGATTVTSRVMGLPR